MELKRVPKGITGLALAMCCVLGCATDQKTINRVQPNLYDKKMFEGAWYVRQTIVDVPPTTAFSFVGLTGELEIIRWEIREDLLVGYRAYEKVPGADANADHEGARVGEQPVAEGHGEGYDPKTYRDNPVVAYPIKAHVDIKRDYNPVTGEEQNVISENTVDRPWNEREFIRIDWGSPKVVNFNFLSDARNAEVASAGYWVDAIEDGRDAFHIENGKNGLPNYFDFSNRLFVPADGACWSDPTLMEDCTSAEVTVRTSFLHVDEERERGYAPSFYDDLRQGEFGFFRTERPTYDRRRGITYSGMQYLANRHDVWEASLDADGKEIPFAQRTLRPIVYALSENYPASMIPVTEQIAKDCDTAFKRVVSTARGQTVEALEADLTAQTGASCLFCLDKNEDNHARVGDLRHNFLYWVENSQLSSPLGYGPSSAHPETGRIVSAAAYVYGAAVDTYAQRAVDMVDLFNGTVSQDDFTSGVDVVSQLEKRRFAIDPRTLERARNTRLGAGPEGLLGEGIRARIDAIKANKAEGLPRASTSQHEAIFNKLEESGLSDLLITPEIEQDFAAERGLNPSDALTDADRTELKRMLIDPTSMAEREREVRTRAERRSIWLADYNDPAIVGLAREAKKKGLKGEALWQYLREQIYRGVMLHELGHTFGLRHNFGASADALNFFPEYWKERVKTLDRTPESVDDLLVANCSRVDASNREACDAQLEGKIHEYEYSSIMDYGARFNSDFHGFGKYDLAALASGYGDLVEVFDPAVVDGLSSDGRSVLREAAEIRVPFFGQLGEMIHYSKLPEVFGSVGNLEKRRWIPRKQYEADTEANLRVPYVGCYDEYRDRFWFCHTWDQGADPYEIADFYINSYEDDYFFNNYARDRVGFGPYNVLVRSLSRYFLPMTSAYQNALFDLIYDTGDERYRALSQLAMQSTFSELWSVLVKPSYGSYALRSGSYQLTSYEPDQGDLNITRGEGRSPYTRYDLDSGYNAVNRIQESGHLYEQIAALMAIVSSDATRLGIGRDVVGGDLAYSIPYYIVFDEQLMELFGSMFLNQPQGYAARVVDGKFVDNPMEATDSKGVLQGVHLNTRVPYPIWLRSAVYGMAEFRSNYSLDYARRSQIVVEGSGEVFTPGSGYETVRFEDPGSGRAFLAVRDPKSTGRWPAAEKLEELVLAGQQLAAMPGTTPEEKSARDQMASRLRNEVQDVDILRELFELFGRSPL